MLRAKGVTKSFGDLTAVDEVTLEARPGEIFGLLGPNGAGKTTLVNMLTGLLAPDRGAIELDGGGPPTEAAARRRLGVAPQALAIYEELTGRENLRFFASLYGFTPKQTQARIAWALDFVGLTGRQNDLARTYSGGMQRRLNLAIALVHDPDVLLCDEPTVGVDPQSRIAILERIREWRGAGRTVIYTTHYMDEAERLCDRVGVMDHGRLLACDTVERLTELHAGESMLTAATPGGLSVHRQTRDPVADLNALQVEYGQLERVRVERPTLEDVFLSLTGKQLRD